MPAGNEMALAGTRHIPVNDVGLSDSEIEEVSDKLVQSGGGSSRRMEKQLPSHLKQKMVMMSENKFMLRAASKDSARTISKSKEKSKRITSILNEGSRGIQKTK